MEPRNELASSFPAYETGVSLSTLARHIITGSPIIVKCKSVPAPFTLRGSPQQDWGHGSLPCRNLVFSETTEALDSSELSPATLFYKSSYLDWSGRWDLNPQSLVSETRRVT